MDGSAVRSLLEVFRQGTVPHSARLLAARGALFADPVSQLAFLALLARDGDAEIATASEATIAMLPGAALAAALAEPGTPDEVREFFADRISHDAEMGDAEDDHRSAVERLATMTVPQKVARAMRGTREERSILIRDPNKLVAVAVLGSPKLTEVEVEAIARMANVSEDVLRIIASRRAWTKNYATVAALARNPKTPVAVSMHLLGRLSDKDLRLLSTSRNVPDALRIAARRRVVMG